MTIRRYRGKRSVSNANDNDMILSFLISPIPLALGTVTSTVGHHPYSFFFLHSRQRCQQRDRIAGISPHIFYHIDGRRSVLVYICKSRVSESICFDMNKTIKKCCDSIVSFLKMVILTSCSLPTRIHMERQWDYHFLVSLC